MRDKPPPAQLRLWSVRSCSRVRPVTSGCLTPFWKPVGRPCAIRPEAPRRKPLQRTESEFLSGRGVGAVHAVVAELFWEKSPAICKKYPGRAVQLQKFGRSTCGCGQKCWVDELASPTRFREGR